jgi:SpoVK/Ycf46/Vps4 family AAA+-type ATPase
MTSKTKARPEATPDQTEAALLETQDNDRIFSGDLWCKIQAIGMYRNLLGRIQDEINDRDWWKFPAQILRHAEITDLYNALISPAKRSRLAESERFRKQPPELDGGDSADEIFDYLYRNPLFRRKLIDRLQPLLDQRRTELQVRQDGASDTSPLHKRFQEMQELFRLTEQECQVVLFLFLNESGFWDLGDVFGRGRYSQELNQLPNVATALGIPDSQLSGMLKARGNLRRFGLLENNGLGLDDDFKDFLNGLSDTPLCDRFYTRFTGETLPWKMHGKLAEEEGAILTDLINARQPGQGQNILLYGLAGTGKTAFAQSLAAKLGKELFFINQAGAPDRNGRSAGPGFRYAGLEVANLRLDPKKTIVCVDECDKMIANASMGEFLARMLGVPADRDGEGKGQLNAVLDSLKLTVLWIANTHRDSIDPSSRRRFDYNVYFDSLSPAARRNIWENALQRYGVTGRLSPEFLDAASHRYQVNAGGISVAVKNAAAVLQSQPDTDFPATVMLYLRSHCSILNIVDHLDGCQPTRDYTLEGLNLKTGPSLERIIAAGRHYLAQSDLPGAAADTPRLNLLLFGPPGTGKTEFVKYLAQQLGRPLNIKMANDLLDCFVGETEHRIVNAFREAAAEKSILFIDEGDSMLGTRANAHRRWEISQVTTLLNQMENFSGIFIMATNFAQNLDPAASRRFTFKLRFDYLDFDGKLHFYNTFFRHLKLQPLDSQGQKTLAEIPKLTPGDFRNVRQQYYYLAEEKLTNAEILKALADEAENKDQQTLAVDFNNPRQIGFELLKNAAAGD